MNSWLALFRGINVSGTNKLVMKELTLICHQLGFTGVETGTQSGKVDFQFSDGTPLPLSKTIASAIEADYTISTQLIALRGEESVPCSRCWQNWTNRKPALKCLTVQGVVVGLPIFL